MRLLLFFAVALIAVASATTPTPVISGTCGDTAIVVSGVDPAAIIDGMNHDNNCENDVQGPNDNPGQKDLNMYCSRLGPDGSYEFYWTWDDINWTGQNTGDACLLLDSNNNGLADLALCVSVHDNGVFMDQRFFSCGDTRPDRCTSSVELTPPTGGFQSTCCVMSNAPVDPFKNVDKKLQGDAYPYDTLARCQVFLEDFQKAEVVFVDVCSYPSLQPNSAPSDCVLTTQCSSDSDCSPHKANGCWSARCDADLGVCVSTQMPVGTICEVAGSESFCDGKNTCDVSGNCATEPPVDCSGHDCGTICQGPVCVEPSVFDGTQNATCGCQSANAGGDCTSECGGSRECQSGTCSSGTCSCSNLSGSCSTLSPGLEPCDSQCQEQVCSSGLCSCGNLPDTTLCESSPSSFCDGKDVCSSGSCSHGAAPTCNGACSTVCRHQVCQEPSSFAHNTDAICVCVADASQDGATCEGDGIVCTLDQCDANGVCQHPPGTCSGCDVSCFIGNCDPTNAQAWDDGCTYSISANNASYMLNPPTDGTSNPICGSVDVIAKSLQYTMDNGFSGFTAGSIAMLVIGCVALLAAATFFGIAMYKRRNVPANPLQQNELL